jgi:ATP-dependent DNA helicase DinG
VSRILREHLFERTESVVLTSATLSSNGNFDFIKSRLGLDFEVEEELVSSPFEYPEQAMLYLPQGMPDPRSEAYLEAAVREVERLVHLVGGGAFILCTSYRVMHLLVDRLRRTGAAGEGLPFPTLVQGDAPKQLLVTRFREAGDAVLFGTSSFWEGVDVPGRDLRLVVLDKLPFGVPTDPLIAARCRRLEEEGERPFMRYLVPAAALALKQGFGRLIRTRRDRGIVALLDARVVSKGYGKVFLRSLPPARPCHDFEEVERIWSGWVKP